MRTGTSLRDLDLSEEPVDVFLSQQSTPWPATQNIVIMVKMNTEFDNRQTPAMQPGAGFKNCRLSAVTQRFYHHGYLIAPTLQSFASSKIVLMGTKDERVALFFIQIFRTIMSRTPNLVRRPIATPMVVCNRVSSGVYDPLDTKCFEGGGSTQVVIQPKSFCAVRYFRTLPGMEHGTSFSFFPTGSFIVTGLGPVAARKVFMYIMTVLDSNLSKKNPEPSAESKIAYIQEATRKWKAEGATPARLAEIVISHMEEASAAVISRRERISRSIEEYKRRRTE